MKDFFSIFKCTQRNKAIDIADFIKCDSD